MREEFAERHVVVTGGTGALGQAVVAALLERGAFCHVPAYDDCELARFRHAGHERVRVGEGVDLRDEDSTRAFYDGCPELFGSLQIAGGFAMAPIAETDAASFRHLLEMNATTCFLCCREAVARIRASGGEGRLVNVAARPALVPTGGMAAYAASKAAVAALTVSLAEELAPEGIWVNAVVPSILDTPANRDAMPDANHSDWPSVEDVADAIVGLASPANVVTRGALVTVYGRA